MRVSCCDQHSFWRQLPALMCLPLQLASDPPKCSDVNTPMQVQEHSTIIIVMQWQARHHRHLPPIYCGVVPNRMGLAEGHHQAWLAHPHGDGLDSPGQAWPPSQAAEGTLVLAHTTLPQPPQVVEGRVTNCLVRQRGSVALVSRYPMTSVPIPIERDDSNIQRRLLHNILHLHTKGAFEGNTASVHLFAVLPSAIKGPGRTLGASYRDLGAMVANLHCNFLDKMKAWGCTFFS